MAGQLFENDATPLKDLNIFENKREVRHCGNIKMYY